MSHLKLALANIHRSAWILGGILCNDVEVALESANEYLRHLDTTPPPSRNHFDNAFMATEGLYQELSDFAHQHGPRKFLLWRGNGKWAKLFLYLAPRFMASPDHVLDCERQHARWQWLLQARRSLKLRNMNAVLRLRTFLGNYQY